MEETDKARLALYTGALLGFLAFMGASLGVEPARSQFTGLASWAYLLIVSAGCVYVSGSSLLTGRAGDFLRALLWSAAIAAGAELLNIRLGAWLYADQPATRSVRWTGWLLSWTSWLPCLLATEELLREFGISRKLNTKPFRAARSLPLILFGSGAALLSLSLWRPGALWPLAIAAPLLLAESLNLKLALPSLAREVLGGIPWRTADLAAAGILVGGLRLAANTLSGAPADFSAGLSASPALFGLGLAGYAALPLLAMGAYSLYCLFTGLQAGTAALRPAASGRGVLSAVIMPALLPAAALALVYFALRATDANSVSLFIGWN